MGCTFEDYIIGVKSQLSCNNDDYCMYVTYNYTEKQIDDNLNYFKKCLESNLSGYKALLFFNDYLEAKK